jgi:hypothetical protein
MRSYRVRTALIAVLAVFGVRALPAQVQIGNFSVAPISASAVFHGSVVEDESGATQLEFALIIRGPAQWWNGRTKTSFTRPDSVSPQVQWESWAVGPWSYSIGYDPQGRTLEVFGRRVPLATSRVVLVTMGATPSDSVVVELGEPVEFVRRPDVSVAGSFLWVAPQARSFAGVPDPPGAL